MDEACADWPCTSVPRRPALALIHREGGLRFGLGSDRPRCRPPTALMIASGCKPSRTPANLRPIGPESSTSRPTKVQPCACPLAQACRPVAPRPPITKTRTISTPCRYGCHHSCVDEPHATKLRDQRRHTSPRCAPGRFRRSLSAPSPIRRRLDLGGIDRIAEIMARPVGHIADQPLMRLRAAAGSDREWHRWCEQRLDVLHLGMLPPIACRSGRGSPPPGQYRPQRPPRQWSSSTWSQSRTFSPLP